MGLFHYFKKAKLPFCLVIFLTIAKAGLLTLSGIASANALSAVARLNGRQFFTWIIVMGGANIFFALVGYFCQLASTYLRQDIDTLIRNDVALSLANSSYSSFHRQTTATYTSWLTNDIQTINEYGIGDLLMIIQQVSEIIMGSITLAYFHYSLLIVTLLLAVIVLLLPRFFAKSMASRSLALTRANERLVNTVTDILDGFNTLFLVNLPHRIITKIDHASSDVKKHAAAYTKAAGKSQWLTDLGSALSQVLILAQSGLLILLHLTPIGTISGAQYFAGIIFAELGGISFNWQEFKSLKPIMNKLQSIRQSSQKEDNAITAADSPSIKLKNLSYAYPEKDRAVLTNITFTFNAHQKYVLLGDSASGKSTLLKLISGLLTDYHGELFLDRQNYCALSDRQLHQKIGYVEQDPYIFNASVKWNLTLGQEVSTEKLNSIIRACGLASMIKKLPAGLDTVLDARGTSLSGGQKQKIAFARQLLRDTPIYLLDEATSSLDKETSNALEMLILSQQNKTVIMVTHHLQDETARLADQIISINELNNAE